MISPAPFIAALPYITAAFSVLQGISGYRTGKENERRSKEEGKAAIVAGEADKARQQRINLAHEATFEAGLSTQGSTFQGSPMLAYLENVKQGALQAEDFNYQGQLKNYYKKVQAADYGSQATSSLFGGFGKAASQLVGVKFS